MTLFSFARFLRISSLESMVVDLASVVILVVSPPITIMALCQISSLSVFISNSPRSSEHSSLLNSLPFLTLCLSFVMALSSLLFYWPRTETSCFFRAQLKAARLR